MDKQRGFVTLSVLFICMTVAVGAQLLLRWTVSEYENILDDIRAAQLHLLNTSFFRSDTVRKLGPGEYVLYEGVLEPQKERVNVVYTHTQSENALFNHFMIKAKAANHAGAVQRLQQLSMRIPQAQQELAQRYALASPVLIGNSYLKQDVYIQANKEEVNVPDLDFFADKTIDKPDLEQVTKNGFDRRIFCEKRSVTQIFYNGQTYYGDAVVINPYRIDIGDNCQFLGRVIIISEQGHITIGRNVRMQKALIMTPKRVVVGAGCSINGLISAGTIELKGVSSFTVDAGVVAPFVSAVYVN